MAALGGVQAALAIGRGEGWDAAGAININEGAKVFYLYRGVLIVLVVALPHCAEFLGLTLNQLLQKTGTIDADKFDKAVWLMCKAMNHLTSNTDELNRVYIADGGYNRHANNIGFIRSFNEEHAKQGQGIHTVIAKSISRIVIRFLFAFSLNLRGMTSAPVVAAAGAADNGDQDAGAADAGADNIQLINREIANATQVQQQIGVQFNAIILELNEQRLQIDALPPEQKNAVLLQHFAPLIAHLESLGGKFQQRRDEIRGDIVTLLGQQGAAGQAQQRISPRTFQNKVNALETLIIRCQRGNIQALSAELERCVQQRENEIALRELLTSAGNTFHGVTPIPGINPDQMMRIDPRFVQRLLEKALVLQANISKLLLTPVTIAYKPSIQDFLSSIGLLESAEDTGDDNDENAEGTVSKRLRSILEPVGAQSQCEQTIGSLRNNPGISCYICGGRPTNAGMTMECEHIFCIGLAIEYFGLLRCSGLSAQEKLFLSILYAWAHRCCNRLKSNISFMKVNPNYKAPAGAAGAAAAAGRNNFFMFHDDNAAKLLGEIFNNSNQHDCRDIDKTVNKRQANKAQFVAAKLPVVSANVLQLVNLANTVFGTVFAASTVLFTAMSCFKNISSLLVIQATSSRDNNPLTMNTQNMFDGFNSILPGVATVQGGGGGPRKNKNKYVGGMEHQAREPVENPDYSVYIKEIVLRPTIEIDELISEEQSLYEDRAAREQIRPQIHEDIGIQQILTREDGNINDDQKYSFLFKLTQITHSLNPLCLYDQLLLLENENANQQTNINTFETICGNYIRINGNYTLNDLSVILLCQMAIGNDDDDGDIDEQRFVHIRGFDVLGYVRTHPDVPEINSFQTGTTTIFDLMSRHEIQGQPLGPLRHHTGPNPHVTDRLRSAFMKLCLVQVNRYQECMGNLSVIDTHNQIAEARSIVSNFIHHDLFRFYCPFDQPIADETKLKRVKSGVTLFKTINFQNYLVGNGYLEFFQYMTDYETWSSEDGLPIYNLEYVAPTGQANSQDSPQENTELPPPRKGSFRMNVFGRHAVPVGGPHGSSRTVLVGKRVNAPNFDMPAGRSRKKNKHNTTKKYRTKRRTSIQSRHVKHKHTRNTRTIKRRKNRRNNRSIRK